MTKLDRSISIAPMMNWTNYTPIESFMIVIVTISLNSRLENKAQFVQSSLHGS